MAPSATDTLAALAGFDTTNRNSSPALIGCVRAGLVKPSLDKPGLDKRGVPCRTSLDAGGLRPAPRIAGEPAPMQPVPAHKDRLAARPAA